MPVRPSARAMMTFTALSGVVAILVTVGLICVAFLWGMTLNGSPGEIIIATWMALGLSKYLFNAALVVFAYSSLKSRAVSEHYRLFLAPSLLLMTWNLLAFPHKLAYGYFAFWMFFSIFVILNRKGAGEDASDVTADTHDASA